MEEIFNKVVKLLSDQLNIDESKITNESDIIRDLGADSLDIVQMLMALEDDFGIIISEDEASSLHTVGDVIALIKN